MTTGIPRYSVLMAAVIGSVRKRIWPFHGILLPLDVSGLTGDCTNLAEEAAELASHMPMLTRPRATYGRSDAFKKCRALMDDWGILWASAPGLTTEKLLNNHPKIAAILGISTAPT